MFLRFVCKKWAFLKLARARLASSEIDVAQIGVLEIGVGELGLLEIGAPQNRPRQRAFLEEGTREIGLLAALTVRVDPLPVLSQDLSELEIVDPSRLHILEVVLRLRLVVIDRQGASSRFVARLQGRDLAESRRHPLSARRQSFSDNSQPIDARLLSRRF